MIFHNPSELMTAHSSRDDEMLIRLRVDTLYRLEILECTLCPRLINVSWLMM